MRTRSMYALEVVEQSLQTADRLVFMYLDGLSDADCLLRPINGCNHINWQVGHLLVSDARMLDGGLPFSLPPLPAGFTDRYDKSTAALDGQDQFESIERLLEILRRQRAALYDGLKLMTEADLNRPSSEKVRLYAPTLGVALASIPIHWMMHAGQWTVIRRMLGHQPLI